MSAGTAESRLRLPDSLRAQLLDFRRRVWTLKTAEAVCAAAFGVGIAYLGLYALDRLVETPDWARLALFAVAAGACSAVPYMLHRWVWSCRTLEQLAVLLTRTHPSVGDQLLGVIELVKDPAEQARSLALCEAAVRQVADDARGRDFRSAVPNPRHRRWAWLAAIPAAAALGLLAFSPAAAGNAWARLLAPWANTPRYTFAVPEPLPSRLVVAHGEPVTLRVPLQPGTVWRPERAFATVAGQRPVQAKLERDAYTFSLPPQITAGALDVRVGDARLHSRLDPTLRPELTALMAAVNLPEYLQRPSALSRDVRGGSVTLVKGSRARFEATTSRDLADARVDGKPSRPAGATVASPAAVVDGSRSVEFRWTDTLGLSGKEPFVLAVNGRDDEAPSVTTEDLPRQRVVLDTEQLQFKVQAQDDFGVKRVGLEWKGLDDQTVKKPAQGERVLAAGGPEKETLELAGTFEAKALGIEPQPIQVRVFAEDFLPGRPRVYSAPFTFYVLNAEQHAIWLTEQLSKWHRQSLEVRDRELQLHETNKQLRALTAEELNRPEMLRRLESQSNAERANGRRLSTLVDGGEELIRQAARNPEFGVGHLERWAEMLQILKDISSNRMPSVAELIAEAAKTPAKGSKGNQTPAGPQAGQVRAAASGTPGSSDKPPAPPTQPTPTLVDRESSQQPPDDKEAKPSKGGGPKPPRLTLPQTSLVGGVKPSDSDPPPPSPKLDEAVKQQRDLLAEFEKIAEELNKVLANLEGSTLVKRLKAASRLQTTVAGKITDVISAAFGNDARVAGSGTKSLEDAASQEAKSSHDVSLIMDDMQSYFERRRFMSFKTVLEEMKQADVVGGLRQLGDDVKKEAGVSVAQCEFWSDTLDRWAEDLVDPASSGACPGSKAKGSLPPSLVLEVLKVLEAEINLREETRVAEQAKPALALKEHKVQATKLSKTQDSLRERIDTVTGKIKELPDAETDFAYEINLLGQVADVMAEATAILDRPETGRAAIAAETDAIELLLKSRRINPKGGGGGGNSPGGGGHGKTVDSALALLGTGVNAKEKREDRGVSQTTGDSGPTLPEEFRSGLDEYFNRIEKKPGGQ